MNSIRAYSPHSDCLLLILRATRLSGPAFAANAPAKAHSVHVLQSRGSFVGSQLDKYQLSRTRMLDVPSADLETLQSRETVRLAEVTLLQII